MLVLSQRTFICKKIFSITNQEFFVIIVKKNASLLLKTPLLENFPKMKYIHKIIGSMWVTFYNTDRLCYSNDIRSAGCLLRTKFTCNFSYIKSIVKKGNNSRENFVHNWAVTEFGTF